MDNSFFMLTRSLAHLVHQKTTLLALQEWETREQYEEYFEWRGNVGDLETLRPWQTQPMSLRFFDKKI